MNRTGIGMKWKPALASFFAAQILGIVAAGAVVSVGLVLNSAGRWFALLRISELEVYLVALLVVFGLPHSLFCAVATVVFLFRRRSPSCFSAMVTGGLLALGACATLLFLLAPNSRISEMTLYLAACFIGGAVGNWAGWKCTQGAPANTIPSQK